MYLHGNPPWNEQFASENRPGPKRKAWSPNPHSSWGELLVSGSVANRDPDIGL